MPSKADGADDQQDPLDPLERKIDGTLAAMWAAPERALEYLVAHQEHAARCAQRAIDEHRDRAVIQRVIDDVLRSQRIVRNAACGDGWMPPHVAFRIEVGR